MNYNIEYKLADLRSSLGKENYLRYYPDLEYTDNNLTQIFQEYSQSIKEENKAKFVYLSDSMPRLDEMKSIVNDILDFYDKNFRVYTSEQEHTINLRFFIHTKFMGEDGDANETSIRIGCKNFAECGKTNANVEKFLNALGYEKSEYFKNRLRLALSHELFHALHMRHCTTIKKEFGSNIYEDILDEVFAEYFSYSYFNDFLKRTESDDTMRNVKRNHVTNSPYQARYFGVGRKYLFEETYTKAEIEEDEQEYERLKADKDICRIVSRTNYPVSRAEYAAGYILIFYSNKVEAGKIGKQMKLYSDMYQQYLTGNAKDALLTLMTVKDK